MGRVDLHTNPCSALPRRWANISPQAQPCGETQSEDKKESSNYYGPHYCGPRQVRPPPSSSGRSNNNGSASVHNLVRIASEKWRRGGGCRDTTTGVARRPTRAPHAPHAAARARAPAQPTRAAPAINTALPCPSSTSLVVIVAATLWDIRAQSLSDRCSACHG